MAPDKPYGKAPSGNKLKLHAFMAHHPQADVDRLQRKLNDVEVVSTTYENSFSPEDEHLGVRKDWMEGLLYDWRNFDWRKTEEEINSFPNYLVPLETRGHTMTVHFTALFSENPKAVPVVFTHGWPGSFIEFLPMLQRLKDTYSPADLPIHAIVPSIIGYGYSSPPPRHEAFSIGDVATLWDQLMRGLGFDKYIAQGGDLGSHTSRILGQRHEACAAVHLNMYTVPQALSTEGLDEVDKVAVERLNYFNRYEFAYRDEHATKPATIGMVVESSPVALLAWIGEKMIRWSDPSAPPSNYHILSNITLYYLTRTFATSLYPYWTSPVGRRPHDIQPSSAALKEAGKPVGYSFFVKEIHAVPIKWVEEELGGLAWSNRHEQGGHFAALEQSEAFLEDVLDFVKTVWKA